jgi:serine/threonine-protein phosphatase PP1 catalytic subunit
VILCEVGLILFKKAGELEPVLFIPIVEALVIKNPIDSEKQRPYMFKVD